LKVRTFGVRYVDYLPHLYLAIACFTAGDVDAATAHLRKAEASGVAARSEVGAPLLAALQVLLRGAPSPSPGEPPPPVASVVPVYRAFKPRPPVLSDAEYERVKTQVMERCGVALDTPLDRAPWYFHYELGEALAQRDDPQRALEALFMSVDRRPRSQRQARMYGMRYTDYLPFFMIAREHAALGNWLCVLDALELSEQCNEVTPADAEFAEFRALVEESRKRAKQE
jgi:hypothetical protein